MDSWGEVVDAGPLRGWLERTYPAERRPWHDAPALERQLRSVLSGERTRLSLDLADRLLVALEAPGVLGELYPAPPRSGRTGYSWPRPHPLRRIDDSQLRAAHTLHLAGMSACELGRRLYVRLGYASAKSCTMALLDGWRRQGLKARTQGEAAAASNIARRRTDVSERALRRRARRAAARERAGRAVDPGPLAGGSGAGRERAAA